MGDVGKEERRSGHQDQGSLPTVEKQEQEEKKEEKMIKHK